MLRLARGGEEVRSSRQPIRSLTVSSRMKIKKLPNVLALHLKRFKYQEDLQKYIKLAYRVAFPFELRLFNTVDDTDDADRLFNLFAIVVHIGKYVTVLFMVPCSVADAILLLAARIMDTTYRLLKRAALGLFSMTIQCIPCRKAKSPNILESPTLVPRTYSITRQLTSTFRALVSVNRPLWHPTSWIPSLSPWIPTHHQSSSQTLHYPQA